MAAGDEATGGIDLPAAWDLSTGSGVAVAVIDTGYRPHADLVANILPGYDFISDSAMANDGNGRDSDAEDPGDGCGVQSSWHGTHTSGTIAAVSNNGVGVAGIAFNSKIVPVRVLGCGGGYESDIADGIVWAAGGTVSGIPANAHPARVLNLSLGGAGSCDATYQNAINFARSQNAVVVVAAGNYDEDGSGFTPANCTGVITVAATNRSGGKAPYSNYGAVVEIAAPGGDMSASAANGVLSTFNTGYSAPAGDSYAFDQGTSMAAPHVAGVVALMLSLNSALTPDQVLSILQSTARAFPAACSGCGSGIVDAFAAVSAVAGSGSAPGVPQLQGPALTHKGAPYTLSWTTPSGSINHYTLSEQRNFGGNYNYYTIYPPTTSKTFVKGNGVDVDYLYRVRACSSSDDSACSAWSNQVDVTVLGGTN